jgi:CRISPR-associated exonuclease Cas4
MLRLSVPEGAIFYGEPRRREVVVLDSDLRGQVEAVASQVRSIMTDRKMPPPKPGPHCRSCSLQEICRPQLASGASAVSWIEHARLEP